MNILHSSVGIKIGVYSIAEVFLTSFPWSLSGVPHILLFKWACIRIESWLGIISQRSQIHQCTYCLSTWFCIDMTALRFDSDSWPHFRIRALQPYHNDVWDYIIFMSRQCMIWSRLWTTWKQMWRCICVPQCQTISLTDFQASWTLSKGDSCMDWVYITRLQTWNSFQWSQSDVIVSHIRTSTIHLRYTFPIANSFGTISWPSSMNLSGSWVTASVVTYPPHFQQKENTPQ